MSDLMSMSGAAWDAQALNGLKRDAGRDPQGYLKQVAQQMEAVFVQMMLKSMRAAVPKDGLFNSEATELFTSLHDQQIAQNMSAKGLGLAEMMVKQLSVTNATPSELAGTVPMALDNEVLQTWPVLQLNQAVRRAVANFNTRAGESGLLNSSNFMARLSAAAKMASQQSGIPYQLIIAQAALESGWGQREILTADGKTSYNLFGIKAASDWDGPVSEIVTTEYEHGAERKVTARFKVYDSYLGAINDYVTLLTQNPRYAEVSDARTPEQAAHALQRAGYATDPHYAQKLIALIQQIKNIGTQAVKAYTHDLKNLF